MFAAACEAELAAAREQIAGWSEVDMADWSDAERNRAMASQVDLAERMAAVALLQAASWNQAGSWARDGALTAAEWLRGHTAMSRAEVARTVRAAKLLPRCERLRKVLAAGDVTVGHVHAMAAQATPARFEVFDEHADVLVDAATTLSVDDLAAAMRRWAAYADDQLDRGKPDDLTGRRGVWFSRTGDLEEMRVLGDPADLAALRALLDRLEPPEPHRHGGRGP